MNNQATLEKMKLLKLNGMYQSFNNSIENGLTNDFTCDEMVAHLIDAEFDDRHNRRITMLVKLAKFRYQALISEIKYSQERNLNKNQILRFSDLNWIKKGENIVISGATGTGKSFLSCAIGNHVCINGMKVLYNYSNKLFYDLKLSKTCGNYHKQLNYLIKKDLIIIDDFGLEILDKDSRMILLEILEERLEKKSIIITSQLPVTSWYDVIGDKTIADAICDRILSTSHRIELAGESLRKIKNKSS
jgi:DNA replication protein DnaC